MKVVICEDNLMFANQLESYIYNYAFIEENGIQVILNTASAQKVLNLLLTEKVDCFFLDIDLGTDVTGLDLAKTIRQYQPFASIIFVTTHEEMLYLTYKYQVEALDFITKDSNDIHPSVIRAIVTAYKKYIKIGEQPEVNYFQIKIGEYIKNINIDDILYFQVGNLAHKIILTTFHGKFEFYQSLSEIEDVDKSFFRCHRGYIINLRNINEVNLQTKSILMKNGEQCPLSFRKIKLLKEKLKSIGCIHN
ncbi:LytR/AlgR family response regulator transcription factor [Metalysinibacillus jejuensis]|uniref:LytR/AlgR family response regulator transcription factor n=1 Tax=Metalysinibacillus jejuensis TaxID=914327 RepID=UPI000D33D00F|nr:LytTR family DNA-binding domain-containing protein [Metalysinibacillus jejuensis]